MHFIITLITEIVDVIYLTLLVLAYLSGSVCSAIIVSKALSLPDPRGLGSGNPGATNLLRIAGFNAAFATLFGDFLKTALPIIIALQLGYTHSQAAWLGVCTVLGHCFPIFFSFKGGKGVASMLTLFVITLPSFALLAIGIWLITAWGFRRSSIASMLTALIIPLFSHQFYPLFVLPFAAASAIVFLQHRKNIVNIIKGIEPIIGQYWNENK